MRFLNAPQIAQTLESIVIRFRSDANVWDLYLIAFDLRVIAIWYLSRYMDF